MVNIFSFQKVRRINHADNLKKLRQQSKKSWKKKLLEICKHFDLRILNGRVRGDSMGSNVSWKKNGVSTIDYIICDQKLYEKLKFFMVKQPTYLSDHSQITAWFSIPKNPKSTESENPEL